MKRIGILAAALCLVVTSARLRAADAPPEGGPSVESAAGQAAPGAATAGDKASAEQAAQPAPADGTASSSAKGKEDSWLDSMLHAGALGLMIQGGMFMWPILAMAVIAAGVMIERWRTLKMLDVDHSKLRGEVLALLEADRGEEALERCARERGPVPAVLTAGIRRYLVLKKLNYDPAQIESQVDKAMEDYGVHIVAALEQNLPILATIASVAPMVGSVGTVWGMIILFRDIVDQFGTTNIIMAAAKGIQVKLLVTVWGLIVGIPAYVAFNYFSTVISRYVLDVEESASELIQTVTLQTTLHGQQQVRPLPNGAQQVDGEPALSAKTIG